VKSRRVRIRAPADAELILDSPNHLAPRYHEKGISAHRTPADNLKSAIDWVQGSMKAVSVPMTKAGKG
jgi:hypothetical protein